ncbi:MAG: DNA polymerase I [Thermodesulfobacteriota bacterium]
MKKDKKTLFIIDGTSWVYRAYHAIPHFSNSKGLPTNAVYGFTQTLKKLVSDYGPDYLAVAFDVKGPTFRHELFEEYKLERPPMPDDLSPQIPYIKDIVRAFNIPVLEKEGYEADDVLATLAGEFAGRLRVVVVTGDKDMFQLVGPDTVVLDQAKKKEYGPAEVEEKFGVPPERIVDLMGLAGDTSDNIPGVPGVGVKTAAKLIKEFGSFDGVFKDVDAVSGKKLKENLKEYKEQAILSRELATLKSDVPVDCDLGLLERTGPDLSSLEPLLRELEFTKLIKEFSPDKKGGNDCTLVLTEEELKALAASLEKAECVALVPEPGGRGEPLRGLALSFGEESFYVPLAYGADDASESGLPEEVVLKHLKKPIEDGKLKKAAHDAKALFLAFTPMGIKPGGVVMDTSLASYLLNPTRGGGGRGGHDLEAVAYAYLGSAPKEFSIEGLDLESAAEVAGDKVSTVLDLTGVLEEKLEEGGLTTLFRDIELPLAEVLAAMELAGIKVDGGALAELSKEMERELGALEAALYSAAGATFNISSPKQVAKLLFEELGLKPLKKTKTGYSTDESVLTRLAATHEVPEKILSYRQLSKLKSTYVDGLLALIDPRTGRVHTSFNQTVTATGRLSSSGPNLQNIPVKGEFAPRIRGAFVAEKGSRFLSADYSQIELRLVAHFSGDPVLVEAFSRDEDVHTRTASEVFGIMPGLVTPEMRRRAKAINFGIIYGMGAYGLAGELGISVSEAGNYIETYFERYEKVREFIDGTIEGAAERGYTETLFGRRRYIPELRSPNETVVRLGERLAVNTPVQGSAADIIKAAMIKIHRRIAEGGFNSRMLLQIHDELVFEVPSKEVVEVEPLVREEMEGVVGLDVPLVVNVKLGKDWRKVG